MDKHWGVLINGKFEEGRGAVLKSTNPATDDVLWETNQANSCDVDRAFDCARKSLESWSALSVDKRLEILTKFTKS